MFASYEIADFQQKSASGSYQRSKFCRFERGIIITEHEYHHCLFIH
jgi:hypothetical protein